MATWTTKTRLRRYGLALGVAALIVALAAVGCGGTSAPVPPTPKVALAPEVVTVPAVAPSTASGTTEAPSAATPTPVPPMPIPTSTPVPGPAGYLLGSEHGLALLQTTREPSGTREGWMDITLDLVVTKFGTDPEVASNIELETEPKSVCFANTSPPHDCFLVAWGSQNQFEAVLRPSVGSGKVTWPTRKAWPYQVTFEVAGNATNASLFFGEHKLNLNLEGDQKPVAAAGLPGPAPTPAPSVDASHVTAGYFMGSKYGVAVTGVSRAPGALLPNWVTVTVVLAVLSLHDYDAFAPAFQIATGAESTCFISDSGDDCIRVVWGSHEQFDAVLTLNRQSGDQAWPRGKGWPTKVSFDVPGDVGQATLLFGDHSLPLDLRGMTGEMPPYDYRANYPEIEVGSILFDFNSKTITLEGFEPDSENGAVVLKFSATNNSEAADFVPSVKALAARVSDEGRVFDGTDAASLDWVPTSASSQGEKLAPGQSGDFSLVLPRTGGGTFGVVPFSDDRPDAVLLQLEGLRARAKPRA